MSEERIKDLEQCIWAWIKQNSELRIENRYIKHKYRNEIDKQRKSIMTLQAENKRLREALENVVNHFFSDFEDYEIEERLNIHALNVLKEAQQALGE